MATLRALLATLALIVMTLATAHAQDAALAGFKPTKAYQVVVDGKPVAAQVYEQGVRPAVLLISTALANPLMLDIRTGRIHAVDAKKLEKQRDGSMDFLAGALQGVVGEVSMSREGTSFTYQKRKVVLVPVPASQ
jgi:hypothetical protein